MEAEGAKENKYFKSIEKSGVVRTDSDCWGERVQKSRMKLACGGLRAQDYRIFSYPKNTWKP